MKTIRIGWLADSGAFVGGAELNANALLSVAPPHCNIIYCSPGNIEPDCDIYIIHNCVSYSADIIPRIRGKRVVKMLHDIWSEGDAVLRSYLTNNATVTILVSPVIYKWLNFELKTPFRTCPSIVEKPIISDFKQRENRAAFVGRLHPQKGVKQAIEWAAKNKIDLDIYGYGDLSLVEGANYKGELEPQNVIDTLRGYSHFVFLPQNPDACPRVIFEAWRAGCKIITNNWQGASYWITSNSRAIDNAGARFWEYVLK